LYRIVAFGYEPADLRALFTGLSSGQVPPPSALGKHRICSTNKEKLRRMSSTGHTGILSTLHLLPISQHVQS